MGAWTTYYQLVGPPRMGSATYGASAAINQACKALKNELAYNGLTVNASLDTTIWGTGADKAARRFQKANGLVVDGVVGPITARALLKKRVHDVQTEFDIPEDYVCKIISLESGFDPAAIGYADPQDTGLVQINLHWHPTISFNEAIDPAFCVPFLGRSLDQLEHDLGDWETAVAAWNVGTVGAHQWLNAGKPEESTAGRYVALVNAQQC